MQNRDLENNASDHHDEFPGEWALSVWSAAGLSADEISEQSPIRNGSICVSSVGALRGIGCEVVPSDEFPHADLRLPREPTEDLWTDLRAAFSEPMRNRFRYEGET
jgi:hypothetical protein